MSAVVAVTSLNLAEGIKTVWAAASTLVAVHPPTRVFEGDVPASGATVPYTVLTITQDREPDYMQPFASGSPYIAYMRAKFETFSTALDTTLKTAVAEIVAAFTASFTLPDASSGTVCRLMSWQLAGEPVFAKVPRPKNGVTMYVGSMEFEAMIQRARP